MTTPELVRHYRQTWIGTATWPLKRRPMPAKPATTPERVTDRLIAVAAAHFKPGDVVRAREISILAGVRYDSATTAITRLDRAGLWPYKRPGRGHRRGWRDDRPA